MTEEIKTDYLVAGAGIAGMLLAGRLAAAGKRVVLLDQGPRYSEADRARMLQRARETLNDFADYNDGAAPAVLTPHTTTAPRGDVVGWANYRLFGIGGTALHFGGIMVRPREDDLKVRTLYGYGRDWPITYAELEPWLLEAERETGVAGGDDNPYASWRSAPLPMPAHPLSYFDREILRPALKRLGILGHSCPRAVNSVKYRGRSPCTACRACRFCPSGARYSPDRVHLPEMQKLPNLSVMEKVSLRRLETDRGGNRVTAAHAVRIEGRTPLRFRAGRYVLAAGGVETPRMLLLSAGGGGHREGLGNMGGQLGLHLSDHLNPYVTLDAGRPVGSRLGFETMASEHFRAKLDRREQPTFMMLAAPALDWFPMGLEAAAWATRGNVLSLDALRESIPRMATLSIMAELEGAGSIELDPGKADAFGSPVARVTMRLTDRDRRSIKTFSELAPDIAEAMAAKRFSGVSTELGMGLHPSGATAMAATPEGGVCDPDLKVFGLENLYLLGNSVFPHMGANPPTLTIAALALRLAEHLKGRPA
jgi:choline dehydrogenase-like flavoprotein